MCTQIRGGGWNRRQGCSNNFVRAIAHGQITDSLLSSILGVKVEILKRCYKGTIHHATVGKRCKSVMLYSKDIITESMYVRVKTKAYLDSKMKDLKQRDLFHSKKEKSIVMEAAERYKSRLKSKPDELALKVEALCKKWEKASEKLRGRYGLPAQ